MKRADDLSVWWRADEELEIVGGHGSTVVLAAEAKWRNDPVDLDVLQTLQRRVAMLPKVAPDVQFVIFSKSGFTPRLEAARTPYVLLLALGRSLRVTCCGATLAHIMSGFACLTLVPSTRSV